MENKDTHEKAIRRPITGRIALLATVIANDGVWSRIYADVKSRKIPSDESIAAAEEVAQRAVTILDPDYPEVLKEASRPPFALFRIGDMMGCKWVPGAEGSRLAYIPGDPTARGEYASQAARDVSKSLKGMGFVQMGRHHSGGIEVLEPSGAASIWSTHPSVKAANTPEGRAQDEMFAAILAERTVVCSGHAPELRAAAFAVNAGRDVFAVPYRLGDEDGGRCNLLIENGAMIALVSTEWKGERRPGR